MNRIDRIKKLLVDSGYEIDDIKRTALGHNPVFEFACKGKTYFVKAAFSEEVAKKFFKEHEFYEYVNSNSIVFPICDECRLFKSDDMLLLVKTGIDGKALYEIGTYSENIFKQLANDMAKLHYLKADAKYIDIYKKNLDEISDVFEELESRGYDFNKEALRNSLEGMCKNISNLVVPSYIHGDLGFANIIVLNNKINGYIDYEWSRIDDPVADLVPVLLWMKGNNINPNWLIDNYLALQDIDSFIERLTFNLVHRSVVRMNNMLKANINDQYVVNSTTELIELVINNGDIIEFLQKSRPTNDIYYFNIDYNCNNRCLFCFSFNTSSNNKNVVSGEQFEQIINPIRFRKADKIVINGGEPTLNDDFYRIINFAASKNVQVDIYTNGRKIDIKKLKIIENIGNIRFIIPVHGDKTTHDYITQVSGSYDDTLNSLKRLDNIRYSLKFIINNQMIESGFSIRKFISDNNLTPDRVIIARQNLTLVSKRNNYYPPKKENEIEYLDFLLKELDDSTYKVVFLDYPPCYIQRKVIDKEVYDYQFNFSDFKHTLIKRNYKKDLLMNEKCFSCKNCSLCEYMSRTYYLLKYSENLLTLELE